GEDAALAFADAVGQFGVVDLEAARHAPEVPVAGAGLGGDEVDHDAGGLHRVRRLVAAVAGQGHADLDHDVAGQGEVADLPAVHRLVVGQAVGAQRGAPERRRHDVLYEAAGHHFLADHARGHRRLVDLLLADAGGVDVGLVGEVHEVVDHQPVVGLHVVQAAAVGPVRAFRPLEVGQGVGRGERGVAGPDPDEAVALEHRVTADAREAADALLRHRHGAAVAAHHQAVVAAHQLALAHGA